MEQIESLIVSKTGVVAAFAIVLILLERLFPAAMCRIVAKAARIVKNLSFLLINSVLSPLIVVPLSALASGMAPDWRPEWWSGWAGLLLDLLILDLWIYWWHRANHEIPFLWQFHQVHHLDEFLDVTSAVRFHFGELLLSSVLRATVIFLLAVPLSSVIVFETLVLLATIFHHSNVKLPPLLESGISRFVVTPSIHWVHHHALRADTDSNYATVLSVWDRMFNSRSRTRRTAAMPIGVEGKPDETISELLLKPFRNDMR
jgi:sterol desaturase/sphingolipid hydroxylase (fatty acid hydroxylase superfamily)